MIIKSLSRKSPSFGQLASYMSSEKSDARFDLYRHCYAQRPDAVAAEFFENSRHLAKRKNGNALYHEILSISVDEGADLARHKEALRDIVDLYVEARCPEAMVYGCLHQDHSHNLHYHLMISANAKGEAKRQYLTRAQFDRVKRELETHVLKHYPELKQAQVMSAARDGETMTMSRKAGEVQRRLGQLPKREEVRETLRAAMNETSSMNNFHFYLEERGYRFYVRGKNYGVEATQEDGTTKKYRLSTLGVHEEFEAYQELVTRADRAEASQAARDGAGDRDASRASARAADGDVAGEKEKERMRARERARADRAERAQQAAERARAKQAQEEAERQREAQAQKKRPDQEAEAEVDYERDLHDVDRQEEAYKQRYEDQSFSESAAEKENDIYEDEEQAAQRSDVRDDGARDAHTQSEEDDMKWRDVMGVRETYQEKSEPKPASRDEVDAAAQKAKREAIDRLTREFQQTSQASSQSQSQSQGQKQGQ